MTDDEPPDDPVARVLHLWFRDRLLEVDLGSRYYSWVHALDRDVRGLPGDAAEHYTLDGDDLRAAWTEQGFVPTGSGKAVTGRLDVGDLRFTSTRYGLRGSSQLELTLNVRWKRALAGSLLHVLAGELLQQVGTPLPDPPYPRPWAYGAGDVHWYVARVAEVVREVVEASGRTPFTPP